MDWNVIAQYLPQYEKAAWLTLRLGVIGILWSIGIGLVCAVLQYDKVPVLRRIVGAYIQLSRNTPLLVQLYIVYYQLHFIPWPEGSILGVELARVMPCILALSMNSTASQSSNSGWVGRAPDSPKSLGEATKPAPKSICHTRFT